MAVNKFAQDQPVRLRNTPIELRIDRAVKAEQVGLTLHTWLPMYRSRPNHRLSSNREPTLAASPLAAEGEASGWQ